jgi:hypothetical protein
MLQIIQQRRTTMNKGFKRALTGLLFVAAFPLWVVDGSASGKISFIMSGKQPNFAEIQTALGRLVQTCRGIIAHRSDFEWIKARTDEENSSSVEGNYGWDQWVSFEVKVKDSPEYIPSDWHADGQTMLFTVGPDGIDVGSPLAGRFCDTEEKTGLIKKN